MLRKLKGQLNAGIDPEMLTAMIQYCGYYIEAGVRTFVEFAKTAIADLGDAIRPYLKSMYTAVRHYPGMEEYAKEMTPYDEVEKIDVDILASVEEQIEEAREQVDTNPTEAQKEAGNYRKGHVTIDGMDITIENPKGSVRSGVDSKGNKWSVTMNNDYGYIRMTEGVDGDHIDVFLSDTPSEGKVFVVDQVNPDTGEFDEHKVMYGFNSEQEAREAYLANYSEGWKGLGDITEVTKEEFAK